MFIQVCQSLDDPKTYEREKQALFEAMKEVNGSGGLILTKDEKRNISIDGKTVAVIPVYEWLLT
jgi:hypothetical protein